MNDPAIESPLSEIGSVEKEPGLPFDDALLHLYRSFWILVQDVDAAKSGQHRTDYKYKSCKSQIPALDDLCKRYILRRKGKSSLEKLTGTTLQNALKHRWTRIGKVTGGKVFKQEYFWRAGSLGCSPEQLEHFRIAYCMLSEQQPELPRYHDSENSTAHNGETMPQQRPVPQSSALCTHAVRKTDSITDSDEDQPLSRKSKRHRTKAASRNSATLSSAVPALDLTTGSAMIPSGLWKEGSTPMQSRSPTFDTFPTLQRRLLVQDVKREMEAMSEDQMSAIRTFISLHLRLPGNLCGLASPARSDSLASLYERCWGESWTQTCDQLLQNGSRSAVNDTMALISAFMYEKIFIHKLPSRPHVANMAILESECMLARAQNLTSQLLIVLDPYLYALSHLRRLIYFSPLPNDDSESAFQYSLMETLKSAIQLKLRIDESEMRPTYIWPNHGDSYDPSQMQSHYDLDHDHSRQRTVAYTIFPGVQLTHKQGDKVRTHAGYKAEVVTSHTSERSQIV